MTADNKKDSPAKQRGNAWLGSPKSSVLVVLDVVVVLALLALILLPINCLSKNTARRAVEGHAPAAVNGHR